RAHRVDCLLVRAAPGSGERPGIVPRTDLLDALTARGCGQSAPVGPLASRPLLSVRADEVLFQALVTMTEHQVERVVVRRGKDFIGKLGMAEVLAHHASSSHLVSRRLARAKDPADEAAAARGMTGLVRQLHAQGAKPSSPLEMGNGLT